MTPPNTHNGEPSVKWPLGCDYDFGVILDANDKEVMQIKKIGSEKEYSDFATWVIATLNAQALREGKT